MKHGIIFQCDTKTAIILDSNGKFITVPAKSHWKTGDVIAVPVKHTISYRYLSTVAACLLLAMLIGFGGGKLYFTQTALISLDVNPSIELGLNRFGMVITPSGLNEEGESILDSVSIKNQYYKKAVASILSDENTKGYLTRESDVTFTVYSGDKDTQSILLSELQASVEPLVTTYIDQTAAEYLPVDEATVEKAHSCGMSPGKYMYLEQLMQEAPNINVTDYTHHSISQIKDEIAHCQQNHGEMNSSHSESTDRCNHSHDKNNH